MARIAYITKKAHRFQVLGKKWRVWFCSPQLYNHAVSKDSKGITFTDDRVMFIDLAHLDDELLVHEMVHVYAKELSLVELTLKPGQVEEFFCELFAKHGHMILKQARSLHQFARKLKWKSDT